MLLPCGAGKTVVGVAIAAGSGARTLDHHAKPHDRRPVVAHFSSMTTVESKSIVDLSKGRSHWTDHGRDVSGIDVVGWWEWRWSRRRARSTVGADNLRRSAFVPADVFRQSAAVQSIRRLGLTATLVREDGREREVFSLVGPTVFSAPWRELERHGWIAPVDCIEVRIHVSRSREVTADRMLAAKLKVVRRILARHPDEPTLIVAHRLKEVAAVSRVADAPMVTGQTPARSPRRHYLRFRSGDIRRLALSRVANVGVDLPDGVPTHSDVRGVRITSGGGATSRSRTASQGQRRSRHVLHVGHRRNARSRVRGETPTIPNRSGIPLPGLRRGIQMTFCCQTATRVGHVALLRDRGWNGTETLASLLESSGGAPQTRCSTPHCVGSWAIIFSNARAII